MNGRERRGDRGGVRRGASGGVRDASGGVGRTPRRPPVLVPSALSLVFLLLLPPMAWGQGTGPADTIVVLDTLPVLGSRVSAELPLRTRSVQVLDRETLASLPARSVSEALRWASGVEVAARSPAQADLSIRGGTFEQLLVLVDGVRMSDPQTGHFDLDLVVPLDRVERIEILRGPASAQYGSDAVGGVVNVVTRRTPAGVGGRLEGGSFGTWVAAIEGTAPLPGGLLLEAAGEGGRSDGHRAGTEWEQLLGTVRLGAPVGGGQMRLEGGLARRDFGAEDFYAPFPSVEATRTETATLAWAPAAGARIRVEPRLTWRGHDDEFILIRENPSVYRNEHRSTQAGADVTVRALPRPGVAVAVGAEVARHRLVSNALGDRAENRGAAFVEAALRPSGPAGLGGRLELSVGLRHDEHARWGGFTSPSLAGALRLADPLRLRASWGRAFRGPTWTERFYADPGHIPNPDVRPERGEAWEVGLLLEPSEGVRVQVAGFTRTQRDLIDWARRPAPEIEPLPGTNPPMRDPWVPRNVSEARFRGAEAEAGWRVREGTDLGISVALLSLRADAEPGFESKYALRPLREQAIVSVRQGVGPVAFSLRGLHGRRGGEAAFREVDMRMDALLARLAGTRLADTGFAGTGLSGARVYLDLRNLFGSDHPDLTGNPVSGRAVSLGLRTGPR